MSQRPYGGGERVPGLQPGHTEQHERAFDEMEDMSHTSPAEVSSARMDADVEINTRLDAKPTVDEEIRALMQHPAWAAALKQRNEMVFCELQERGHPIGLHIISKELLREMLKSGLMVTQGAHYTLTEKGREVFERVRAQH